MAMIQLGCILTICLTITVYCNCQSVNPSVCSSWAKLPICEISPETLSSIEYGNFLIKIYEHVNNHNATTASQKKYFYAPMALLDHSSAVSVYNYVTKQPEMRFRVEMWNDKVQNEMVKHLHEIVGHEIKPNQVRVIPFEKVILTSNVPAADYSLSPEWTTYDQRKTLRLSLSCYDQKVCDKLANEMRSAPEHFDHFKLLFSLSSQSSQTKQTTISIDSVISGQMVTNLLLKFEDKNEVFLTANDVKKMLAETAASIRMDTFDDSEVGSPDTESQIYNILKDILVTSRTTIKEQSDNICDSVFWNDDQYRPDRTTKTLNEIINKLDAGTQKKLADMFEKMEKQSEIIEKFTVSNKDAERRREEQFRRENQTKDANENGMRRSQATDQFITRNQIEKWELAKNYSDEHNRTLEDKERIQHNYDPNSWVDVDRISLAISGKLANASDSSHRVEILKEDVEKLLEESRSHVQWDGEEFVPKPMQLSRINLGKFRDSQSFPDRKVRVRFTSAELSAPIKFMEHAELTATDEWIILKDELKATKDLLNTAVINLMKTSTELTNTRIDLTNKLEGTKQELEKTRAGLSKNIDDLSSKLNATEKELAEMKIRAGYLSTELKANSQRLGHEIKIAEDSLKKEIKAISKHLETTTTDFNITRTELSSTKSDVSDLTKKLNARTSEIVDIGKMPTSCADLQQMGHKLSGFFSVKGLKKMEIVYCDFYPTQNDKQKWIGYADVKSAPAHFYVQRNSTYSTKTTPMTFDMTRVNQENAMNLTSGKFTAPQTGIYFFSFTGMAQFPASSSSRYQFLVGLYLNGNRIGTGWVEEVNTVHGQMSPLTLQSTLHLKKGDEVWVQIDVMSPGTHLYSDNHWHPTHFTGFMLEEEIVATF